MTERKKKPLVLRKKDKNEMHDVLEGIEEAILENDQLFKFDFGSFYDSSDQDESDEPEGDLT